MGGGHDFVWTSTWGVPGATKPGVGRAVIFRLVGNPLVTITGISQPGLVAANGRSAYACANASGVITVTLSAASGAAGEPPGTLWGIDVNNGQVGGDAAPFEVRTP